MSDQALAYFSSYTELHAALRQRAEALGISRETIDAISGLQPGYAAKLLAPRPLKKLGALSMGLLFGALGCKGALIEDPEAMALIQTRLVRSTMPPMHSAAVHCTFSRRFLKKIARKGGKNSRKNIGKRKRRELARKAARARWQKLAQIDITTEPQLTKPRHPRQKRRPTLA